MKSVVMMSWMGLSIVFMLLASPHLMLLILILQALLSGILVFMLKSTVWLSYVLFLVFLGGMLVIFCYVSSLAPGDMLEEVELKVVSWLVLLVSLGVLMVLLWGPEGLMYSETLESMNLSGMNGIKWMYCSATGTLYLYTVAYLLLALVCVASLMKSGGAPLRLLT